MKITQEEAEKLIAMIKKYLGNKDFVFPNTKGKISFEVKGERRTDDFVVNIDRKGPDANNCTYQGRIKSNNVILMRIDITRTGIHTNPSTKEKIYGSHIHLYSEEYDIKEAIPIDWDNKDLYEACFDFFERFHIIENPKIERDPNQELGLI